MANRRETLTINHLTQDVSARTRENKNTYDYVDKYIDRSLPQGNIGYIVDRTGFMENKKCGTSS